MGLGPRDRGIQTGTNRAAAKRAKRAAEAAERAKRAAEDAEREKRAAEQAKRAVEEAKRTEEAKRAKRTAEARQRLVERDAEEVAAAIREAALAKAEAERAAALAKAEAERAAALAKAEAERAAAEATATGTDAGLKAVSSETEGVLEESPSKPAASKPVVEPTKDAIDINTEEVEEKIREEILENFRGNKKKSFIQISETSVSKPINEIVASQLSFLDMETTDTLPPIPRLPTKATLDPKSGKPMTDAGIANSPENLLLQKLIERRRILFLLKKSITSTNRTTNLFNDETPYFTNEEVYIDCPEIREGTPPRFKITLRKKLHRIRFQHLGDDSEKDYDVYLEAIVNLLCGNESSSDKDKLNDTKYISIIFQIKLNQVK
jgi:chemotaxis protein histidine kinase CheA